MGDFQLEEDSVSLVLRRQGTMVEPDCVLKDISRVFCYNSFGPNGRELLGSGES